MKLKKIYLEITNNCNLNCDFCIKNKRNKEYMKIDNFKTILNKIKNNTEYLYFHILGEPLMHPKINELIDIASNRYKVNITTNGTLLQKQKDILFKHSINKINVSLHSENNMNDYFEKVFEVCDELSLKMTIVYRIWTLSSLKLDNLSTKIVEKIKNHYHLNDVIVDKIMNNKNIKIKNQIYLAKDYEFIWPEVNSNQDFYGTCYGTRNHIAILSNGNVVPCCLDSNSVITFGNIFKDDLNKIIQGEMFQKIYTGFCNGKVVADLCKSCTYRKRFDKKILGLNIE